MMKFASLIPLLVALSLSASGQRTPAPVPEPVLPATPPSPSEPAKPLPDIATLMSHVEANERRFEALEKNYIYHRSVRSNELDGHDVPKKPETREQEVFWLHDAEVIRTLAINGKALTPEELKKEDERLDKVADKRKERRDKADEQGKETDSRGNQEITLSRILELGSFSNPRREIVNGRPTIAVDYTGDPKAKTHNMAEGIIKELSGTAWVDEQDEVLQHTEGRFANDFKVFGGIVASVKKGTWFRGTFVKINNEVWFPQTLEGSGQAHYLLFFNLHGEVHIHNSDYRKFKATSTILPGVTKVDGDVPNADSSDPKQPDPK